MWAKQLFCFFFYRSDYCFKLELLQLEIIRSPLPSKLLTRPLPLNLAGLMRAVVSVLGWRAVLLAVGFLLWEVNGGENLFCRN